MTNKEKFEFIINTKVNRAGKEELLNYLAKSDFYIAPASAKFHNNFEGGLVEHSVNVYNRLHSLVVAEYGADYATYISDETIALCGLLHDVCKIDYYKIDYRNTKIGDVWTKVPYFSVNEILPYGHGEKSVYIVNSFIKLTRDEALAINWHMGGFDARAKDGSMAVSQAFNISPLVLLLHTSDMLATYIDEKNTNT